MTQTSGNGETSRKVRFVVDSGASDHMVNDERMLEDVEELEKPVFIATAKSGTTLRGTKRGKSYGLMSEKVRNYEHRQSITDKAIAALTTVHGTWFQGGSKYETIYPSSGGSIDWAYQEAKIPISLTFELREPPDSTDMFILPAEQITPVGEETLAAFVAIVEKADRFII
ncbi:zinc carboxypeptidase-like [Armigeres subalbatus]|uniref:zinc carboxypeptidase-like n=1 Tax=Armigeres subalbatus TaxID=124917 RepID=UPI002ED1AD8B